MMTDLENAARRWARMWIEAHESPHGLAFLALDIAAHDLVVAAGERCPYCAPGTCPGADIPADIPPDVGIYVRPMTDTRPL